MNYNPSQVGVPYVRVNRLVIEWPDGSAPGTMPTAILDQAIAVKLADGSIRTLDVLVPVMVALDFNQGNDPIPLINPEDAAPLGADTTLNQAMLAVLAVIRKHQIIAQG